MLPLEAAVQYELLTARDYEATDLTRSLVKTKPPQLYEEFGRHILLDLGGLRVVEAVEQMQADGLLVTGDSLASYLTDQGFRVTVHNTAINSLRMWLEKARVFSSAWNVDLVAKEKVLGLSEEAVGILADLNDQQRAFVTALCRIDPHGWYKAADVRALAEANSGLRLGRASLPKEFLHPLEHAGLVEYRTRGTRSGKSTQLRTTADFRSEILEQFVTRTIDSLDPTLTAYYTTRPQDIYADLVSSNSFRKGRALEAYAVHIMRLLGLRFVGWRKRAEQTTGRAEVDILLAGLFGGVATRWQIQCKNTPSSRLDLEDVAKEVGLLLLTRATHIMVIANCPITQDAQRYATQINRQTAATVILLDRREFESIKKSPGNLGGILRAKAEQILRQQPTESLWS